MGVLDLPAPVFAWLDGLLNGILPATARLILWGIASAILSMGLYWALSPQRRIVTAKAKLAEARRRLDSYDGDFAGGWPLIREMLRFAFRQLGLVTWPAVVASLPVLFVIVWLSNAYGYAYPTTGAEVTIRTVPQQYHARWIGGGNAQGGAEAGAPRIVLADGAGRVVGEIAMTAPVPVIHKRKWWNVLLGNPVGYLPDAPLERVDVELPAREYLGFGPSWLRSWEFVYFVVLLACSIAIKVGFRIA